MKMLLYTIVLCIAVFWRVVSMEEGPEQYYKKIAVLFMSNEPKVPVHQLMLKHAMNFPDTEYTLLNIFPYDPKDPAQMKFINSKPEARYDYGEREYMHKNGDENVYLQYDVPVQMNNFGDLKQCSKKCLTEILQNIENIANEEFVMMPLNYFFHIAELEKFNTFLESRCIKKVEVIHNQIKNFSDIINACHLQPTFAGVNRLWEFFQYSLGISKEVRKVVSGYLKELEDNVSLYEHDNNVELQLANIIGKYIFLDWHNYHTKKNAHSLFLTIISTYRDAINNPKKNNVRISATFPHERNTGMSEVN